MADFPPTPSRQGSFRESRTDPSLVRNTVFNSGAYIVNLVVGLVVSPVLLTALGVERYGLWSLLWAITGSLSLLDVRVAAALTPLVATEWAREEHDRVVRLVTTGLTFYAALGILELGGVLLWTRVPGLLAWIPEPLKEEGTLALIVAVAVFALNSVALVFRGVLNGLQRFDQNAQITMAMGVFRCVVLVTVALAGGGLPELLLGEAAVACFLCATTARAVRRLLPGLRFIRVPSTDALRDLLAFGGKLQIAHIAHLISLHADKLLLSAFLGLPAVAYYDLGQKIAYVMRGLPLLSISATMPVVSAMEVGGDRDRLWEFYRKCMRIVVFAATPLFVFTVTGAGEILLAWVGVGAPEAQQAVWLLALGYYLFLISVMANHVALGMKKPELEMRRSVLVGTLNLGLSASLIPLIGFAGAPLGTALALAAGSWYLIRAINAEFGQSLSAVLGMFHRPVLAGLPAAGGGILVLSIIEGSGLNGVVGLLGSALFIGTIFLWLGIRDEILTREWLRSIPARLRPPATRV